MMLPQSTLDHYLVSFSALPPLWDLGYSHCRDCASEGNWTGRQAHLFPLEERHGYSGMVLHSQHRLNHHPKLAHS